MRFTNLPQECRISIFTITGEIVKVIERSSQFDGNEWWDLRTENNQEVANLLATINIKFQNLYLLLLLLYYLKFCLFQNL